MKQYTPAHFILRCIEIARNGGQKVSPNPMVGSLLVENNEIIAARCVLPISENSNFPANLGMRHRAALGITESTDAIAIAVSEQTGEIALAKENDLQLHLSPEMLREHLEKIWKS